MAQELKAYNVVATADVNPEVVDNLGCTEFAAYDADEVDAVLKEKEAEIAEITAKNKRLEELKDKYSSCAEKAINTIAKCELKIRMLSRALWVTRTAFAKSEKDRWNSHVDCGNKRNRKDPAFIKTGKLLDVSEWRKLWADNERKCRAKAEEYK